MLALLMLNAVLAIASSNTMSAGTVASAGTAVAPATATSSLSTPQFRRFGIADGLPGGQVYAVAQDRRGLMWFASAGGLVRYDGVDFKVFRHATDDPTSLPFNAIFSLMVDRQNRIWGGGISGGLFAYDQADDRFRYWEHDDARPASLASDEVWSIAQTSDGAVWVATQEGLDRLRADGQGFDHVPLDVGGRHTATFGETRALLAEPDGRLWIAAESGLYLRQANGSLQTVTLPPSFEGSLHKIWAIEGDGDGVRVAMDGGLLEVGADGVARPLVEEPLSTSRIQSSVRDLFGRLWIGKADGLLLEHRDHQLQSIQGHPLLPGGLPGSKVWQTFVDREGGLWITFEESCIAYLAPGWDGFTRFTHIPDDQTSLSNISPSSIRVALDGRLWAGGDDGWVDKLDVHTGRVEHTIKGLRGQVAALAEDARQRLWIVEPGGLQLFDHGVVRDIDIERAHVSRPVLVVAADDGKIYLASWGEGIFTIDPDSLAITPVTLQGAGANHALLLPSQLSFHDGSLWYGSAGGLMRMQAGEHQLALVQGVAPSNIRAFDFDADGLWIATEKLLEHYRYSADAAVRDDVVDIDRAALGSDLTAVRVGDKGGLWLFGNPGLWRLDKSNHRITAFGPEQGLSNAAFGAGMTDEAPDGMIFALDSEGVAAFQPARLLRPAAKPPRPPPLSLVSLAVRRDGAAHALPLNGLPVQLGWRDRDLRVVARFASYLYPQANHYRFHLSGFDSGWVDVDSRGERDFAGLGAGSYRLEVMAAGADGRWSRLATPLDIHVQSPPWMRWWAWLAYLLLGMALVYLGLRGWRRRLAQRHHVLLIEQQRQMAETASAAKTQFLATLSHEIRTPMTGVMGMAELLLSTPLNPLQHDYAQAMQRSGTMLLKLLNDALDLARIEAGKLELEPAPFDPRQLLQDVAQLEQGLAQAKGLRFLLEGVEVLPLQMIGDPLRIKQVLLNLANNALKFTERGQVTLRAQRLADGLLFTISDTGPGIPEASQARLFQRFEQEDGPQRRAGSGLGLAICRELVEMMGGSIELVSRLGHGSTFRVRLPLIEPADSAALPEHVPVTGSYRLLLVEDDSIVAAVIRGLLERQDHRVVHVINGLAALAELAHGTFDAVLLDLDLPGVDGFQIARLIRQREQAGEHLPIVAVTARSGSEDESRAQAAGMDGFLRKPLTGEQLAAALTRMVAAGGFGR